MEKGKSEHIFYKIFWIMRYTTFFKQNFVFFHYVRLHYLIFLNDKKTRRLKNTYL